MIDALGLKKCFNRQILADQDCAFVAVKRKQQDESDSCDQPSKIRKCDKTDIVDRSPVSNTSAARSYKNTGIGTPTFDLAIKERSQCVEELRNGADPSLGLTHADRTVAKPDGIVYEQIVLDHDSYVPDLPDDDLPDDDALFSMFLVS